MCYPLVHAVTPIIYCPTSLMLRFSAEAVFLASEGARNINGESINVDGGAVRLLFFYLFRNATHQMFILI